MRHIPARILNLLHRLLNNRVRRLIRVRDDDLAVRGRDSGSDGEEGREGCEDLELHFVVVMGLFWSFMEDVGCNYRLWMYLPK